MIIFSQHELISALWLARLNWQSEQWQYFSETAESSISHLLRYHGREGWAPASYLKKADIQSQKLSAGAAAHASTNDLDGVSKQNQQNNAARENRDNSHKENRLSFFSDNKSKKWILNPAVRS